MLVWVESKGCRSWLQGGCKGPCGVALSGQMRAGWGSGGRSAGRIARGGGRRVGYREKRQKGNSCSCAEKWWKMWLLDSCSCRSMSKQPSAAVICANISRDYGLGASWERLKRRGRPDLTESLSFLTRSQQEYNHETTIYAISANKQKAARWGLMTLFCVWS